MCIDDCGVHFYHFLQLLHEAGIMVTCIYSSLDQTARKINVAKFVNKKVMVMIVTDVAVSQTLPYVYIHVYAGMNPCGFLPCRPGVLTFHCWITSSTTIFLPSPNSLFTEWVRSCDICSETDLTCALSCDQCVSKHGLRSCGQGWKEWHSILFGLQR